MYYPNVYMQVSQVQIWASFSKDKTYKISNKRKLFMYIPKLFSIELSLNH